MENKRQEVENSQTGHVRNRLGCQPGDRVMTPIGPGIWQGAVRRLDGRVEVVVALVPAGVIGLGSFAEDQVYRLG